MKVKLIVSILFLFVTNFVIAQSDLINYKAIISDNGSVLVNTSVTLKFTILENATIKYVESHTITTDINGIAIVNIGDGAEITGSFTDVIWSNNNHFLKTEVDTGSGFIDMGTSEFHAVPYAISGGSVRSINDLSDAKTFGTSSIFLGTEAGINSSAFSSVGIGYRALKNNAQGHFNTAIGSSSLSSVTSGEANVGLGLYTLYTVETGNNNIAVGTQAGLSTTGNNNIFLGHNAGLNETGSSKLYIESSDSDTPLIGGDFSTDEVIINGTLQITGGIPAIGKVLTSDANGKASWELSNQGVTELNDLSDAKTSAKSLYIGDNAGRDDVGINYNTAIGDHSMLYNTTGKYNLALGRYTLFNNTTGSYNTSIGQNSGSQSFGSRNIFIGYEAGMYENNSDKLYIENSDSSTPLIGGDFSTDEVIINGTLQITGGTPAVGKVLTSDANGKASWETSNQGVTELNDLTDVKSDGSSLFVGADAGGNDDGENGNVAVGYAAIRNNVSGTHNTVLGQSAGVNSFGSNNVILGYAAGYNVGSGNIIIGNQAYSNWSGTNNILVIDNHSTNTPLLGGNFETDEIVINGKLIVTDLTTLNNVDAIKSVDSGDADLKAYIYGMAVADGSIVAASSSSGFTVTKIAAGNYKINFTGVNKPTASDFVVNATRMAPSFGFIWIEQFGENFHIRTNDISGVAEDAKFSFVVYKK